MNDNNTALTGGAGTQQKFLDLQISLLLFDLGNEATEHGFHNGNSWILQLATAEEIAALKKNHRPVISLKLYPDALLDVFTKVKQQLQQSLSKTELLLTVADLGRDGVTHMAAYPPNQMRN